MVSAEARSLKRRLDPLAWSVLEDVALDVVPDVDDALAAATSCRRIAAHLGVNPGTAARALARLEAEGLLARRDSRDGTSGRFGRSTYVLAPLAGIGLAGDVGTIGTASIVALPHSAWPCPEPPDTDERLSTDAPGAGTAGPGAERARPAVARRSRAAAICADAEPQLSLLELDTDPPRHPTRPTLPTQ